MKEANGYMQWAFSGVRAESPHKASTVSPCRITAKTVALIDGFFRFNRLTGADITKRYLLGRKRYLLRYKFFNETEWTVVNKIKEA